MDKNTLKKIGITLLILGVAFLIYFIILSEDKTYFKKIKLTENNQITNRHSVNYLDTIVSVGLDKLAIENTKVLILPLNINHRKLLGNDLDIKAHVRAYGNFYYIWIDNLSKKEFISVLSHEIIHIHQYYTGRISYDDNFVIWNKKKFKLDEISYEDRPWENEAFIIQGALSSTIEEELYRK